jgi:hypothetical protein
MKLDFVDRMRNNESSPNPLGLGKQIVKIVREHALNLSRKYALSFKTVVNERPEQLIRVAEVL